MSSDMCRRAVWREGTDVLTQHIPVQRATRSTETFISVDQTVRCHITEGKASRCYGYIKFLYKCRVLEYFPGKNLYCIVYLLSTVEVYDTFLYLNMGSWFIVLC